MAEQTCRTCDGTGRITCEGCGGFDAVYKRKEVETWAACARCHGEGRLICSKCHGSGKS